MTSSSDILHPPFEVPVWKSATSAASSRSAKSKSVMGPFKRCSESLHFSNSTLFTRIQRLSAPPPWEGNSFFHIIVEETNGAASRRTWMLHAEQASWTRACASASYNFIQSQYLCIVYQPYVVRRDTMAEWSKALCSGRSLNWRGFKSPWCHSLFAPCSFIVSFLFCSPCSFIFSFFALSLFRRW